MFVLDYKWPTVYSLILSHFNILIQAKTKPNFYYNYGKREYELMLFEVENEKLLMYT